jgi:hypothetical protein
MTEEEFWRLIETAKKRGEDPDEQMEWLISSLTRKSIKEMIEFDAIFHKLY